MSPHKVPRWAVVLDAIPLTERGKPDHRRLRELAAASIARPGVRDVT